MKIEPNIMSAWFRFLFFVAVMVPVSIIFGDHPGYFVSTVLGLVIFIDLFFTIFATAVLKIEDEKIFLWRILGWQEIGPDRIREADYFSFSGFPVVALKINGINLINRLYILGIRMQEKNYIQHLMREEAKKK